MTTDAIYNPNKQFIDGLRCLSSSLSSLRVVSPVLALASKLALLTYHDRERYLELPDGFLASITT